MAHGREVTDLVRLHFLNNADQVGAVGQYRRNAEQNSGYLYADPDTGGQCGLCRTKEDLRFSPVNVYSLF